MAFFLCKYKFQCQNYTSLGRDGYHRAIKADGYEVIIDTKGSLLWQDNMGSSKPLLVIASQQVSKEYLAYLEQKEISWIACGRERVDLVKACQILAKEFGVKKAAVVGGGHINAGFLAAGLLDEVSILIGAGIDGRGGMAAVFDGLPMDSDVAPLELKSVEKYGSGAVWIRYQVK